METLSSRNAELLCKGASIEGSFEEGIHYIMEDLYVGEATPLTEFAKWIDEEVGGASKYNINTLFLCYKNPNSEEHKAYVKHLKEKIAQFK